MTQEQIRIRLRLKYLRGEIEAERISYGEIAELEDLADHIEPGDVLLLQWAGVPEHQVGHQPFPCNQQPQSGTKPGQPHVMKNSPPRSKP